MSTRGVLGFTARELKVIAWRTNGIQGPEIARRLGLSRQGGYNVLSEAMRKARVNDVCLLTRWAMANGLDEELGPEDPADIPEPEPKGFNQRIELGRIRRAGIEI